MKFVKKKKKKLAENQKKRDSAELVNLVFLQIWLEADIFSSNFLEFSWHTFGVLSDVFCAFFANILRICPFSAYFIFLFNRIIFTSQHSSQWLF